MRKNVSKCMLNCNEPEWIDVATVDRKDRRKKMEDNRSGKGVK